MSDAITLSAKKRDVLGKQVRALRRDGQTPGVVHDHGKASIHISMDEAELKKAYSQAGGHHPINLDIEGTKYTTLIKEVTHQPASAKLYHSVFQAIKANETVKADIPIKLVGEIPAERASLLVLQTLDHVEVEALPKDLVDAIEVDATTLAEVGDRLHVSDLQVPSGLTVKTDPEQTIATVEMPKDQVAEADAALEEQAEADGTTAEGEEAAEGTEGEAAKVPSEHGDDSTDAQSKGEIRPGGKKEFEDHEQGTNPTKQ